MNNINLLTTFSTVSLLKYKIIGYYLNSTIKFIRMNFSFKKLSLNILFVELAAKIFT